MSIRSRRKREKSPFMMVIYIIVVLALIGGIVWLWYCSKNRSKEYQEKLQEAVSNETEITLNWEIEETESETETEEPETESESETETEEKTNKEMNIMVLNATKTPGIAGYWVNKLKEADYTNVYGATANGNAVEDTVIYASQMEDVTELKELFPNASVQIGTYTEEYEVDSNTELPEDVEIYIVIGRKDIVTG